ncbi:hypothetical protein [Streptomyces telluris]|uniref:Uncharacterized protein n=1 Tax=Streptomyces telluris TaxID=2720021 RepID=A0A9X2LIP7_9ACTN|nr:hypothetical protein [Streptomyces telluris]MCQ8772266.1 hypothetical protein [Streptomyces telluris]NJP75733.1 hypothetical protein [Streptomyces telluris]
MRTYVVHQPAAEAVGLGDHAFEFDGFRGPEAEDFKELFLGRPGEPAEERAARISAARDVLEELRNQSDADEFARLNARYAARLSSVAAMKGAAEAQRQAQAGRAA